MANNFLSVLVCSVLLALQITAQDYSCYSNETRCLSDVRKLLVDTDKFFFGSPYETSCPGGPLSSPACGNPDTNRKSVLSRFLNLTDTTDKETLNEIIQTISLANITFSAPAGNYSGCGHDYQVPALNDYLIDPLNITRVSSWSLSYTPRVTWNPRTEITYHTLIIWDPGNFFLHGLYINCVNGSLDSGVAVRPYFGPLNAYLRANTYIFAVYEQTSMIDLNAAMSFLEGQYFIQPAAFVANFSAFNSSYPAHAGIMTIVADPYSVQKISDRFFMVNNCPLLISQLDTFRSVIRATNVSVPWSNETMTASLLRNTPFLTSLTTNIDVRYSADALEFESCCKQYSLTPGMYIANPFSDVTVRPAAVRNSPQVQLTAIDIKSMTGIAGDVYTLFMLDVAPVLEQGASQPALTTHWLVTNIRNADVNTGDVVAPYFGSNPLNSNNRRPYVFLLMRQPVAKLNNTVFSTFCKSGTLRCQIRLKEVLDAWNLREIVGLTWFVAEQDAFARYRLHNELGLPRDQVCSGQSGYANPCPSTKTCGGNIGVSHTTNFLMLVFLLGVVQYYFSEI